MFRAGTGLSRAIDNGQKKGLRSDMVYSLFLEQSFS
jgi:hypothetical protein